MRLIDADALRKCFEVPHELKCGIQAGMDEYALKCIDEQPTITASPWHRVEESPKKYGTYIVYWKDGEKFWWEKADWDEDWCTEEPNWYSYRDSRATIIEPDYWMPIEPPKEDA